MVQWELKGTKRRRKKGVKCCNGAALLATPDTARERQPRLLICCTPPHILYQLTQVSHIAAGPALKTLADRSRVAVIEYCHLTIW